MERRREKQSLILACSLFLLFLWQSVAAVGAVPYTVQVQPVTGEIANVAFVAGSTQEQHLQMVIKDVNADDLQKVRFTFPQNYFTVVRATAQGITVAAQNNVVEFDQIKRTDVNTIDTPEDILVEFIIKGNQTVATTSEQIEKAVVNFGSGAGQEVPITVQVSPEKIDISKTTLEVSYSRYDSQSAVNQDKQALATVVARFTDKYGNISHEFPDKQAFYLAANNRTYAEIALTAGGGSGGTNPSFEAIVKDDAGAEQYYILRSLGEGGRAVFQVTGEIGRNYNFKLGAGDEPVGGSLNGTTVETFLSGGIATNLNFALASLIVSGDGVDTHNQGRIQISLDFPNFDLTGKKVEVQLPPELVVQPVNENGRVDLTTEKNLYVNVVSVAGAGTYTDDSTDGGFKLFIDGQEYMLTKFDGCSVTVNPAKLTVEIDNELDYRHGLSDTVPDELIFTVSGMDSNQVANITFKLPGPDPTRNSTGIQFYNDGTNRVAVEVRDSNGGNVTNMYGSVSADGSTVTLNGRVKETQKFILPISFAHDPQMISALNEVYLLEIFTTKGDGTKKVEQSEGLKLRYRITDAVIVASATDFGDIKSTPAEGNQCAIELSIQLNSGRNADGSGIPETELNGRGLYVWITDEDGNTVDVKDRFDIQLTNGTDAGLKLINTELGIAEGNKKGDRNIFRIYNDGDATNVSSIEMDGPRLNTSQLDFKIISAINGTFKLNIGTGRNASEALSNSKNPDRSKHHAISESFVFVSENERPILNIRNSGDIFYNYDEAGLAKPGPGTVVVEIDNIKFPESPTKQDNIYLHLPDGLVLDPLYMEQGYLMLNRHNMEASSSTHYRAEIAVESISDALKNSATEDKIILDGSQFIYYRGETFATKVQLAVSITSDLTMGKFITYLNQFVQASFDQPAYVNTDIALNISPTGSEYKSDSFAQSKGVLLWFSTVSGEPAIVTADQMTFKANGVEASVWSEEDNNKFLLPWADGTPGQLGALAVQFKEVGQYRLNLALYQQLEDGAIVLDPVELKEAVNVNSSVTTLYSMVTVIEEPVTPPEPEDSWLLNLQVDGSSYTDNNHVYTVTGKKIGEKIAVQGTLTDKITGAGLAGVKVTASGSAWTYTGDASTVTTDNGVFNFVVAAENVGTPHLLTLTMEDAITTSYSIQITVNDPSIVDSEDNYTLRRIKTVTPVALDRMAAVYLEAYDRNDDKIEITSNSMAENMFKSLRFSSIPDRSSLSSSDIIVRARNGGIEVYFYPDYRGSYYLRMETNSTGEQVLSASIDAIVQNTARSMDLIYPETTLGIGKTSSPARILTYDNNGVEAEEALNGSGWTYYYTGNGVASMDSWGRVTLKKDDRYIGSTVTVTVVNERLGLSDSYTFNIDASSSGDSSGTSSNISGIVLPDDYGAIGQTNQYQFYLVDRQGFTVELADGQMNSSNGAEARVTVSSKPYNASVDAYISSNGVSLEDNGYGYLYVSSSKEGTVRLNISLKIYNPERTEKNNYRYKQYDYYTKSVAITFKENAAVNTAISEDKTMISQSSTPVYDKSVAIFLGTNQYRVNMNERVGDAVPFIRNDRIMVPIRTISEGVGANVEFDDNTQIIEMKLDQDWVYAQVGSNIIRTNYGNLYSEVMPVIINGRTFLPLRTAAEALGCNVEAVYDVQGNTIGAVFMK